MKSLGVRIQLAIWFAACLVASLAAFSVGVYLTFSTSLLSEVDRALEEEIAEVVVEVKRSALSDMTHELNENFAGHDFYVIQVIAPGQRILFATPLTETPLLDPNAFPKNEDRFVSTVTSSEQTPFRMRAQRVLRDDGEYVVVVGDSMSSFAPHAVDC